MADVTNNGIRSDASPGKHFPTNIHQRRSLHLWQFFRVGQPSLTELDGLHLVNTLGHQLTEAYDFTTAMKVAVREFAPDKLIILGPGTTLRGAVAQSLIVSNWLDR